MICFSSAPTNLYSVNRADRFTTDSSFAYWKLEDKEAYSPQSLEDEAIRKEVIDAWRQQQAIPLAKARAEELVKLISAAEDKSMSEVLGEVSVTGEEGGTIRRSSRNG